MGVSGSSVNTARGESQERALLTGRFALAEVPCAACGSVVGWNYVRPAGERAMPAVETNGGAPPPEGGCEAGLPVGATRLAAVAADCSSLPVAQSPSPGAARSGAPPVSSVLLMHRN